MAYTVQQIIAALKLYDKIKKVVPTVRQLGYPAAHTLYEWINQRKATNGKFPNLMPSGVKSINLVLPQICCYLKIGSENCH